MLPNPERLQTAMTLYSMQLSALILMVDRRLNSLHGLKEGTVTRVGVVGQSCDIRVGVVGQSCDIRVGMVGQSCDIRVGVLRLSDDIRGVVVRLLCVS